MLQAHHVVPGGQPLHAAELEPARAAGKPGGLTERARTYINPEYGTREPIDWERPAISWPFRAFLVLVDYRLRAREGEHLVAAILDQ